MASLYRPGQAGASPTVSFDASRLNVGGRAHTLSFKSHLGRLQQRALLTYDAPRLFNAQNLRLTLNLFFDNSLNVRTFTSERLESSAQLEHIVSRVSTLLYRFTYRRVPAVALARKLVADGRIGQVRHVRAQYLQDWIADPDAPMTWRLDKERAGSGALGDIGAHIVDLTQYVTGEQILDVSGLLETFVKERLHQETGRVEPVGIDDACAFLARFQRSDRPTADSVRQMPSQTYDHVWIPGGGPTAASEFVTSTQCIGCHDAGSTGVQFDMTRPDPAAGALLNDSPYATWRTSPMGLGGRDPIFFAQLASETETFHPDQSELVQNVCLGCHGVQGQRQFGIDHARPTPTSDDCPDFTRADVDAVPYPSDPRQNPDLAKAPYGALARDGISCTACHHMALTTEEIERVRDEPQNRCVKDRQELLNPMNSGFARTFGADGIGAGRDGGVVGMHVA